MGMVWGGSGHWYGDLVVSWACGDVGGVVSPDCTRTKKPCKLMLTGYRAQRRL